MTPEEVLLKAVEVIERDGWYQGDYYDSGSGTGETAPVCALGAIHRAICGHAVGAMNYEVRPAEDMLVKHLGLITGLGPWNDLGLITGLGPWNDAPERTKEDVILAMKKAANHDS